MKKINKEGTPPIREREICPRCEGTIFHRHRKRAQTSCRTCGLVLKEPYNRIKGILLTQIENYDYFQWDLEEQFDYWFHDPITPIDETDLLFEDNNTPTYEELSKFGKKIKRINKDPRNASNCAEKVYLLKLHKQTPYVKDDGEIAWRGDMKEWRLYQAFYRVENIASHYKMAEHQTNWVKRIIEEYGTQKFHRHGTDEEIILALCQYIMQKTGRNAGIRYNSNFVRSIGLTRQVYRSIKRKLDSLVDFKNSGRCTYNIEATV